MLSITKEFTFDAAHRLADGYKGKCSNIHGHTYKVQVTVSLKAGKLVDKFGMVMDFSKLKKIWDTKIEEKLDHNYLNVSLNFQSTAENLCGYLFQKFSDNLKDKRIFVSEIKIWETPTSFASYTIKEEELATFKK